MKKDTSINWRTQKKIKRDLTREAKKRGHISLASFLDAIVSDILVERRWK